MTQGKPIVPAMRLGWLFVALLCGVMWLGAWNAASDAAEPEAGPAEAGPVEALTAEDIKALEAEKKTLDGRMNEVAAKIMKAYGRLSDLRELAFKTDAEAKAAQDEIAEKQTAMEKTLKAKYPRIVEMARANEDAIQEATAIRRRLSETQMKPATGKSDSDAAQKEAKSAETLPAADSKAQEAERETLNARLRGIEAEINANSWRLRDLRERNLKTDVELKTLRDDIARKQAELEKKLNAKYPDMARTNGEKDLLVKEHADIRRLLLEIAAKLAGTRQG
ncbi:MAG: hypothetical protein QME60_01475 [Verrucomicrobiota bacterium]|nr:hypothetical protein [Verrucomicrobiota bacterium]